MVEIEDVASKDLCLEKIDVGTAAPGCPFERSSKPLVPTPPLIFFHHSTLALRLLDHFLRRHLLRRLRPLPLLIPPIMKRLVRPLFLHPLSLHPGSPRAFWACHGLTPPVGGPLLVSCRQLGIRVSSPPHCPPRWRRKSFPRSPRQILR